MEGEQTTVIHTTTRTQQTDTLPDYLNAQAQIGYGFALALEGGWLTATLSTVMFGVLTVCILGASFVLMRRNLRSVSTVLQLLTMALIYGGTCLYWALMYRRAYLITLETMAATENVAVGFLCEAMHSQNPLLCALQNEHAAALEHFTKHDSLQDCAGTAALAVYHLISGLVDELTATSYARQVVLGDAIVWWRAWVIWQGNRAVSALGIFLLLGTIALATTDTAKSCKHIQHSSGGFEAGNTSLRFPAGTLFQGYAFGIAACVLSLVTNLAATCVVAYKAWTHWRLISKLMRHVPRRSQVGRILALITESGIAYCIVWTFVVAYQLAITRFSLAANSGHIKFTNETKPRHGHYHHGSPDALNVVTRYLAKRIATSGDLATVPFVRDFEFFVEGCLIWAIAIHPTLVILLVTLNRSYNDNDGLSFGCTYLGKDGHLPPRHVPGMSEAKESLVFRQFTHTVTVSSAMPPTTPRSITPAAFYAPTYQAEIQEVASLSA